MSEADAKIPVNGIILILSCQKYANSRLQQFKLPRDEYAGWKVIYVIGDLFLDCDYKLDNNLMIIKCEDSYIHLLKKLVLTLKYLYKIYDIKDGVLRSGDDLIFNERLLELFLSSPKKRLITNDDGSGSGGGSSGGDQELEDIDFLGNCSSGTNLVEHDFAKYKNKSTESLHYVYYYREHPEDFDNPQHNIKGLEIAKYIKHPITPIFIHGPLLYFSNKTCKILIEHMEAISYDIFHYDEGSGSYPYTTEDLAIAYILFYNKINFIHCHNWYRNTDEVITNNIMAIHTNIYR
jgi:hypothetical protein